MQHALLYQMQQVLSPLQNCRTKKNQGTVSNIQGPVTALPPTPRISGKIIQNGSTKGHISVLPDSGSVAGVIPESLASSLNLAVQQVRPEKYSLSYANVSHINVV